MSVELSMLESKTLSDLREIAKSFGVQSVTKYKKNELLDIFRKMQEESEAAAAEEAERAELAEEPPA